MHPTGTEHGAPRSSRRHGHSAGRTVAALGALVLVTPVFMTVDSPTALAHPHDGAAALDPAPVGRVDETGSMTSFAVAHPDGESAVSITGVVDARAERGGEPGVVRATVANLGTSTATGVRVRYHLPNNVAWVPDRSSAGCGDAGDAVDAVECRLGALAAGASVEVSIGVAEPDPDAVVGTRGGWFEEVRTDGFDPFAGEILMRTWYHEAGAEGSPLIDCWQLANPSPNMDVAGGGCDGIVDSPALTPDEETLLEEFPAPFSQPVVRSWEWRTVVTPSTSGSYRVCSTRLDDGAYFAIWPAEREATTDDVVHEIDFYGHTGRSRDVELEAGRSYRVLLRVSNRGIAGVDNGNTGNGLAGWGTIGIVPADGSCLDHDTGVFGTGAGAWTRRIAADVEVVAPRIWAIGGIIESAPATGTPVTVSVRFVPRLETVRPPMTVRVIPDASQPGVVVAASCIQRSGPRTATCAVVPNGETPETVVGFSSEAVGVERVVEVEAAADAVEQFSWSAPLR